MNGQVNPTLYPTQQAYGYSNPLPRGPSPLMSQFPPNQHIQTSFQQPGPGPHNPQNPSQQLNIPQQFYQQFQTQHAAFGRTQSQGTSDLSLGTLLTTPESISYPSLVSPDASLRHYICQPY